MLLDEAPHHILVCVQGMDSPLFVLCHEAAITFHIRTENGSELALNFLGGHGILLKSFINGRIETTFYKTLVLEWFVASREVKTSRWHHISTFWILPPITISKRLEVR
jgi:hypothetical protein